MATFGSKKCITRRSSGGKEGGCAGSKLRLSGVGGRGRGSGEILENFRGTSARGGPGRLHRRSPTACYSAVAGKPASRSARMLLARFQLVFEWYDKFTLSVSLLMSRQRTPSSIKSQNRTPFAGRPCKQQRRGDHTIQATRCKPHPPFPLTSSSPSSPSQHYPSSLLKIHPLTPTPPNTPVHTPKAPIPV